MGDSTTTTPAAPELRVDRDRWLAEILANSPDAISILDLDGRLLYINRTAPSTTPDEVVGRLAGEFVPGDHRARWDAAVRRAVETGEAQNVEIHSAGDFWWDTRIVPIRHGGAVAYLLVLGRDETKRKRAEQAVAIRDEHLAMAAAALEVGFWRIDVAAGDVTLDSRGLEILGLPREAERVALADAFALVHPDDLAGARAHLDEAVRSGSYADQQFRIVRPQGTTHWLLAKGKVRRSPTGEATEVVGAVIDVTATRLMEEQRHRARRLEAIGQLAGGVAHDFNNLLVSILGGIALAMDSTEGQARREVLADARLAAERAAALTRQLLAFGRREHQVGALVDLNEVVADTLRMLRRLLPETILVHLVTAKELPLIAADRGQLEQVILNLCVNARDSMPRGGKIALTTEVVGVEREARSVRLTVTDTGVGIAPEHLDRVFEPYFTTKDFGTGLGLATVYAIVQQHGGMIQVRSELAKGTTFEVCLPVSERGTAEIGTNLEVPARGGTETILVADDDSGVRSIVVRILERAGYRVLAATNGAEAVATFEKRASEIDAVLLDSVMPFVGGLEALEAIRSIRPDVGTVLSSGYSADLRVDPGTAASDLVFLPKPYDPDALLRSVRTAIERRRR